MNEIDKLKTELHDQKKKIQELIWSDNFLRMNNIYDISQLDLEQVISNNPKKCSGLYEGDWNKYWDYESNKKYFECYYDANGKKERYFYTDRRHLAKVIELMAQNTKDVYHLVFVGSGHFREVLTFIEKINNNDTLKQKKVNIIVVDPILWPYNSVNDVIEKISESNIRVLFSHNDIFDDLDTKKQIYDTIDYFYFSRCINPNDSKDFDATISEVIKKIKQYNKAIFCFSQVVNESAKCKKGHINENAFLKELENKFQVDKVEELLEYDSTPFCNAKGLWTPFYIVSNNLKE